MTKPKPMPTETKFITLMAQYYSYRQMLSYVMSNSVDVTGVMVHLDREVNKLEKQMKRFGFDVWDFEKTVIKRSKK